MPAPTLNQRHIDRALTDDSIAFRQGRDFGTQFLMDAFRLISVPRRSDKYHIYDGDFWNRRQARKRAPGDKARRGGYKLSNDSYSTDLYSLAHKDPRESQENADEVIDPQEDNMEFLTQQCMMEIDVAMAAEFFATGKWGTDIVGTLGAPVVGTSVKKWSESDATPITDVARLLTIAKRKFYARKPNVMVLGTAVWDELIDHDDITDRVKHTSSESITTEMVARLFQLDEIIVPDLVENDAKEGVAENQAYTITEDAALLVVRPESGGKKVPAAAYVFGVDAGEFREGHRIATWFDDDTNSDIVQCDVDVDFKITGKNGGVFINDLVD